jgi:fido (protein-threonine AMPylation protein)
MLLDMHRLIFASSWPDEAGRFRTIDVRVRNLKLRPPHYSQLSELAYQHLEWIDGLLKLLGPVTTSNFLEIFHVAADLQFRLIRTFPFRAGNWRIARAMADYILIYSNLFYNVIDCHQRDRYQAAVANARISDISPLEDVLLKSFGETLGKIDGYVKLLHQEARASKAE